MSKPFNDGICDLSAHPQTTKASNISMDNERATVSKLAAIMIWFVVLVAVGTWGGAEWALHYGYPMGYKPNIPWPIPPILLATSIAAMIGTARVLDIVDRRKS